MSVAKGPKAEPMGVFGRNFTRAFLARWGRFAISKYYPPVEVI